MAIEWDESLKLGHEGIDTQHMQILEQINSLSDKISEGADKASLRDVLNYLSIYAKKHFFDEEKLMEQYFYYGLHKQKIEHTKFKNEIDELSKTLNKKVDATELAHRVETTLYRYFIDHISRLDKEMADFINFQNK